MNLVIFSHGRIDSTRCPAKMVKDFAGTTLTDIMLEKLEALNKQGYPVFSAGADPWFRKRAEKHHIPFIQQSVQAAHLPGPTDAIFHYLSEVGQPWVLFINACLPFLQVATILAFIEQAKEPIYKTQRPAFAVVEQRDYFLNHEFKAANFTSGVQHLNTQFAPKMYRFAHALYLFQPQRLLETGFYWGWDEVNYIPLPETMEMCDIDTEGDFYTAEVLYNAQMRPVSQPRGEATPG